MVLAGILAAQPLTGKALAEHTIMIAGDGAAGTALAELLAEAIARQNMRCARAAAARQLPLLTATAGPGRASDVCTCPSLRGCMHHLSYQLTTEEACSKRRRKITQVVAKEGSLKGEGLYWKVKGEERCKGEECDNEDQW